MSTRDEEMTPLEMIEDLQGTVVAASVFPDDAEFNWVVVPDGDTWMCGPVDHSSGYVHRVGQGDEMESAIRSAWKYIHQQEDA